MLKNRSGFDTYMKNKIPEVAVTHSIIYCQNLVSKTFSVDFCVKIVNYIRRSALNHRFSKVICSDIDDNAFVLLFHTRQVAIQRSNFENFI